MQKVGTARSPKTIAASTRSTPSNVAPSASVSRETTAGSSPKNGATTSAATPIAASRTPAANSGCSTFSALTAIARLPAASPRMKELTMTLNE